MGEDELTTFYNDNHELESITDHRRGMRQSGLRSRGAWAIYQEGGTWFKKEKTFILVILTQ